MLIGEYIPIKYLLNLYFMVRLEVDKMNEEEIKIVMNALAGYPTLTSAAFADKVKKILREYSKKNQYNY